MPQRQSKRSTHAPVMASPDHSRRSADSDEELGRNKLRGDKDWEFLVGTAISVYQNSGGGGNNWSQFEEQRTRFGQPTIEVSFAHRVSVLQLGFRSACRNRYSTWSSDFYSGNAGRAEMWEEQQLLGVLRGGHKTCCQFAIDFFSAFTWCGHDIHLATYRME